MNTPNFLTFSDFWPFYVREHSRLLNRKLHFVGTASILPLALAAIFFSSWLWILVPVSAYGFAWYGHFYVEKNKPATFIHPFWSLIGDFRMFAYMLSGRMDAEVQRCTNMLAEADAGAAKT